MIERDWKSDPVTGELVIGDDIVMVSDAPGRPDSIRQDVEERLQNVRGEWFLDPDDQDAIPLFDGVLVKNPNLATIRGIYERAILATPGVGSVLAMDLQLDRAARRLSIKFTASTYQGEIAASVSIAVGG
jgi:hypothetical protein